jgi:ketosteroid isomerase-like protein
MSADEHKAVVRRFFDAINQGTFDILDEVLAPTFRTQGDNQGGREGEKQLWQQLRAEAPETRLSVEDMLAEGDKVVTRWSERGTYRGQPVQVTGMHIHQLADGKIVEAWAENSMGNQPPAV